MNPDCPSFWPPWGARRRLAKHRANRLYGLVQLLTKKGGGKKGQGERGGRNGGKTKEGVYQYAVSPLSNLSYCCPFKRFTYLIDFLGNFLTLRLILS